MGRKGISNTGKAQMLEIDQLVFRFQEGDDSAGEELLKRFGGHPKDSVNNYIGKFFHMLREAGRFSFSDKDSRKFICCFIEDEGIRKAMQRHYQTGDVKLFATKKLRKIIDQVKPLEDEELKQELRLMFIKQAKQYKNISKNINFPGYLYNSYGYAVAAFITRRMKKYDPYNHMYTQKQLLHLQEDRYVDKDTEIHLDEKAFQTLPMLAEDDELGNSWVRGITCGPEFKDLTPLQRHILKLYYEDNMTDKQIASQFAMHINTIHNNRKRAIKKIEEAMERLRKEGYEE